jgi:thiol reductant ABC exporter CydC subunit
MALAAALGLATIGSSIGLMATSAWIIAAAALHPSIAALQVAIVGVRFFGIARGAFRYLERYVSHHVTFRLLARLRVWFYAALEPLAPARLMQYRSGDLLSRAVADIETLQNFYGRVLAPPLVAVGIGFGMWVWMRGFDPRLAAALVAGLCVAGAGVPLLTRLLSRAVGQRVVTVRAELNAALVDGVQGIADIIAFGQETNRLKQVQGLSRELTALQGRMAWISGLHGALGNLLMSLAALAVLVIAIPLVNAEQLDGVYLAVLVLAAMASFEAVLPLPLAAQHWESSLEAARRLFEIADCRLSERSGDPAFLAGRIADLPPTSCKQEQSTIRNLKSAILVEGLRFRYAPDEPLVLDGISFHLPRGGCLAIVGPSGAGKTTLVNLLLRFWDHKEGEIWLNDRALREYPLEEVRALMGVVAQNTHLFNATIRENLLLARPDASDADLERAARQAQIHAFIASLPQGYDTWIGEQGLRLSGGERQRLAIARALLKDAPILILDEPTANLDTVTERAVMQAIHTLMAGPTTLIITHRLVGLEVADEIVVLRAGQVVERGRHTELLARAGLYRRMWELQNQVLWDTVI